MRFNGCLLLIAALGSGLPAPAQTSQDDFFGLDKIWDIHLVVKREDWTQMFPTRDGERRSMLRMYASFPYRTGDVTIGTHTMKGIGVRFKGNSTFSSTAGTLKRSFKLDFNRNEQKDFLGLVKLNLHCNALDGTQIKEAVSYQIYRDSGVVSGRTCFARVYLTIPGEVQRTYLGLYTVVDQVDSTFAKRTLGDGLIMKPEGGTLAYRGDAWNDDYARLYVPKSAVTEDLTKPLLALAKLYEGTDDEAFAKGVEAVMDMERFLRYTAVTTLLVNTDSPLALSHNYYLIVPSTTKKVVWVPWDLNLSMGGFSRLLGGTGAELSILKPSRVKTFTRVLAVPRFAKRYREIVTEIIEGPGSAKAMTAAIQRAHDTVKDAIAEEASRDEIVTDAGEELGGRRGGFGAMRLFGRRRDDVAGLLAFATAREKSVKDQLAGKSQGRAPGGMFGGGGGNRGGFGRGSVRGFQVRDALAGTGALDPTKETFNRAELDAAIAAGFGKADADGSGDVSRDELAAVLRRQLTASRGSAKVGGFDLASSRSRRALSDLDGDGDGSVTAGEWRTGIDKLLSGWDRNDDGAWTRKELNVVPPKDG